mgnify:CR=1 FL=1
MSFACLSKNIKSAINRTYCRLYTSTFCYNPAAGVIFARLLILRQPHKESTVSAPTIGRIVKQQSLTVSDHVSNSAGKNPAHRSCGNVPILQFNISPRLKVVQNMLVLEHISHLVAQYLRAVYLRLDVGMRMAVYPYVYP